MGMNGGDLTRRPFVGLKVTTWPEALRYCRVERGFSFAELREKIKSPPDVIKGWEYGTGEPDRGKLRLLYQALPKLRNYAQLLPETLKHEPSKEPTGEATAPEVAAEVIKAQGAEMERPSRIPDPASYKSFAEALTAMIKLEGMTHKEFAEAALSSQTTISRYCRDSEAGMTRGAYDRIVALLPDLARAPKPAISDKHWVTPPGRKSPNSIEAGKLAAAGGPVRSFKTPEQINREKLARVRATPAAELPPAPPKPNGAPVVADLAALPRPPIGRPVPTPAAPVVVEAVTDAAEVQRLTDEMTKTGAAYGVACATVVRLRRSLQIAESQIAEYHAKIREIALKLGVVTE